MGIRRCLLLPFALPYLAQNVVKTFPRRYISCEEALTRIEHSCPGITECSLQPELKEYAWRRKGGKALSDPYEATLAADEFELIPEGEPRPVIRMTTLQSFAHCRLPGYIMTMSQSITIFTLILIFTTFYWDFVNARKIQL